MLSLHITNPYITQELLDEVLSNVSFSYCPMDVEFLGDFRLDVGDIVRIGQGPTSVFVPIMHISHESDGGIYSIINSYSLTEGGSSLSQAGGTNIIPSSAMVGAINITEEEIDELWNCIVSPGGETANFDDGNEVAY